MDEEQRKEQLRRENAEMAAQLEQVCPSIRPPARPSAAGTVRTEALHGGKVWAAVDATPALCFGTAAYCTTVLFLVVI